MRLKLMQEYGCSPVWDVSSRPARNLSIAELKIDDTLRGSLEACNTTFQNTFDASYPPDSGFKDPAERAKFLADGEALAERLRTYFESVDLYHDVGSVRPNGPLLDRRPRLLNPTRVRQRLGHRIGLTCGGLA
jgi:hypothetical protein